MITNLDEAKVWVSHVEREIDDNEEAHKLQDKLYVNFIEFVAYSCNGEIRAMALECLKVRDMKFTRWYA